MNKKLIQSAKRAQMFSTKRYLSVKLNKKITKLTHRDTKRQAKIDALHVGHNHEEHKE